MRDLVSSIAPKRAISPVSVSNNTAAEGEWIDLYGYDSCTFVIATGSLADSDATFAVLIQDADAANKSDVAAVDDAYLIGTEALAGFKFDDDNKVRKIGYKGSKRYVRITITPSGNSDVALISAVAILGHPFSAPTANPPA